MLLSSHILSEVEALCDRVSIIRAGRIVDTGTLADLRHLTRTSVDADPRRRASPAPEAARWPASTTLALDGAALRCSVDTDHRRRACVAAARQHGIQSLTCQPPTLEELFLRQYRDDGSHPARDRGRA